MEWDGVTRELLQLLSAHSPYKMNELALSCIASGGGMGVALAIER